MKRILLLGICLGFLVFNYSPSTTSVYANSDDTSYVQKLKHENKKLTKENEELRRQSKQNISIPSIASSLVAPIIVSILVPFASLLIFSIYRSSEIIDFERPLLDFKTRAQISIANTFIVITALVLTVILGAGLLIKHPYWFWPIEILVLIFCIYLLYSLDKIPSKHALVFEFHRNYKESQYYTIIHKLDDTFYLGKLVQQKLDSQNTYEEDTLYKLFNKDSLVGIDAHIGKITRRRKDLEKIKHKFTLDFFKRLVSKNNSIYQNTKGVIGLSLQPNEYIKNRLNDQISWYDKKSATQKKWYYWSKVITLICTASIPVISVAFRHQSFTVIITAVIAAIATITEGILTLTKWHEKWIAYRSNAEALKHEKYSYLTSSGVYSNLNNNDKFHTLVDRTENIISNENTNWASLGKKERKN